MERNLGTVSMNKTLQIRCEKFLKKLGKKYGYRNVPEIINESVRRHLDFLEGEN